MLKNKAGLWKSVDSWIFKPKNDGLISIENTSKAKVLETTNQERLFYIGHSMGTTGFLAMAAS